MSLRALGAVVVVVAMGPGIADAGLPALLPRETFFPPPLARQAPRLSPDGRWLSYVSPDGEGMPQLWLQDLDHGAARPVTRAGPPGVGWYAWAEDSRLVCYEVRQSDGSRLSAIEIDSGRERALVDRGGARLANPVTRPDSPHEMLLSRRPSGAAEDDVFRLDLVSGALTLDTRNPGGVSGDKFFADPALVVRAVLRNTVDGGNEILVRDTAGDPWRPWMSLDSSYWLDVLGFTGDGRALLLRTDRDTDTTRVVERRIADGRERVIAGARDLDVESVLLHPRTGAPQAASYLADPRRWEAIEHSLRADLRALEKVWPGQAWIAGRDRADSRWLVYLGDDHRSRRCYLWDRAARRATLLFVDLPHLDGVPLARVKPLSFRARDGLRLRGYLTLPLGVEHRGLPLVVWVHGGPYLRDAWGLDLLGQFFVNRGYAFLRVNYRGSRGFGRRQRLASFKQWGRAMQDDIVDAVEVVARSGVVDRRRMGIAGHSYGGYVALAALTLTPDLFRCAAASSTTANLPAFVSRFPKTHGDAWVRATVGDPEVPSEAEMLRGVSPFFRVDRLARPLVVARGDQDGALPPGDIDAFVDEIERRGGSAVSIVYEGDGHFYRRENELDYYARVERLFAQHLGGRAEPAPGDRRPGSTGVVRVVGRPFDAAASELAPTVGAVEPRLPVKP